MNPIEFNEELARDIAWLAEVGADLQFQTVSHSRHTIEIVVTIPARDSDFTYTMTRHVVLSDGATLADWLLGGIQTAREAYDRHVRGHE